MLRFYRRLLRSEAGATAVEYGLIVGLVALGMLGSLKALGASSDGLWGQIVTKTSAVWKG